MLLTGPQFEKIKQALLVAYTKASLRATVRGKLNVELDQVAGGENDTEIVFNLVRWAERESRVPDLVDVAVTDNPTNEELQKLKQAAEGWHLLAPQGAGEPEPYKGLDFFGVDDAILFFGREDLTRDLVNCLKDNPFLAVVGASGSGKSSVVRAGVVAALQDGALRGSKKWLYRVITPTARPIETLAITLMPTTAPRRAIIAFIDDMVGDPRSL